MLKTQSSIPIKYSNDILINQRQIINTIQLCSKIIRQDKLYLRQQIKLFFKSFCHQQGHVEDQLYQLIDIFNKINKPLNQIHRYQSQFLNLQIQLRKYINHSKKKSKQQSLNIFKKQPNPLKPLNPTPSTNPKKPRFHHNSSQQQLFLKNNPHDLKKIHSPRTTLKQYHHLQTQRSQHRSTYKKSSCQIYTNKSSQFMHNKNLFNYHSIKQKPSHKHNPTKSTNYPIPSNSNKQKNHQKNKKQNPIQISQPKKIIQLFTQSKPNKQNLSTNINQYHNINNKQNYFTYQHPIQQNNQFQKYTTKKNNYQQNIIKNIKPLQQNNHNIQDISLDHWQPYKYQPNKDFLLNTQNLSTIKPVKYHQNLDGIDSISNFHQNIKKQNLFTNPELLEQCRRIIKYSEMSPSQRQFPFLKMESYRNISPCSQPNTIQSLLPHLDPIPSSQTFTQLKPLLKHLFKSHYKISLPPFQFPFLKTQVSKSLQKPLQYIFSKLDKKTNILNYLDIIKQLKCNHNISFQFSNIFELFDVENVGFITQDHFWKFLQNFKHHNDIEQSLYNNLKQQLQKFYHAVFQVFQTQRIFIHYFQYLELVENVEFFNFCQLLQLFEFQIDHNNDSQEK